MASSELWSKTQTTQLATTHMWTQTGVWLLSIRMFPMLTPALTGATFWQMGCGTSGPRGYAMLLDGNAVAIEDTAQLYISASPALLMHLLCISTSEGFRHYTHTVLGCDSSTMSSKLNGSAIASMLCHCTKKSCALSHASSTLVCNV